MLWRFEKPSKLSNAFFSDVSKSIIQPIDILDSAIEASILREDLLHPQISGNKFRKLKYNIQAFLQGSYQGIVTLGGAFSNHIAATAYACRNFNIPCIGIIRGEEHHALSNPTLLEAQKNGMQLIFIHRSDFQKLRSQKHPNLSPWISNAIDWYFIPEGGANEHGFRGCQEILDHVHEPYDYVICACGTGSTLAGLASKAIKDTQYIGISALKGDFMQQQVQECLQQFAPSTKPNHWSIQNSFHHGGYGKTSPELWRFIQSFEQDYQIPLDQVYTGKLMYAVFELIRQGYFKAKGKILCIHTGGLQGKPLPFT